MAIPANPSYKSRFVIAILASLCLALLGGAGASRATYSQKNSLQVKSINKTNALQVLSVTKTEGAYPDIEVTLVNKSNRNIVAYILRVGELSIMSDYGAIGAYLAPGDIKVEKIPFGNFEATADKDTSRAGELIVAAVYFQGGTGEGEAERLKMMKERYAGTKEQIELALLILREALKSAQPDSDNALHKLEAEVELLPTQSGNIKLSPNYRAGRDEIKNNVKMEIRNLQNKKKSGKFDYRESLHDLITSYERILLRFSIGCDCVAAVLEPSLTVFGRV